jgi:putative tryptophan/tyrosine transport system substrate-binding protein
MKRRDLLSAVAAAAFVLPPAARSQQPRRIGLLRLALADAKQLADIRQGLEEAGYAEGRNLVIEYRYAEGDYARLPDLAADLVRQDVEVIITSGGLSAVSAAMRATSTIPIVGTSVDHGRIADPLVKHFNRPEGNVTGVSLSGIDAELTPKRLQILAELAPGAAIGVLMNPTAPTHQRSREVIEEAGRLLQGKACFRDRVYRCRSRSGVREPCGRAYRCNPPRGRAVPRQQLATARPVG